MKNAILPFFILLFAGLLVFSSCSGSRQVENGIARLTNDQFKKEAAKTNTVVIDVRTPEEFNEKHIEGAMLMNYNDTENFMKQIATLDPSKHYLLYCRSGKRSMNAANLMKSKGFKKISDLKEGISGWTGPTVTGK